MEKPRALLEEKLRELPGISIELWKDTQLVCVFFHGKSFAHFHGENILDIRLSSKVIREEQLSRVVSEKIHPERSKNSRWIGIEFQNEEDIQKLMKLVNHACAEL